MIDWLSNYIGLEIEVMAISPANNWKIKLVEVNPIGIIGITQEDNRFLIIPWHNISIIDVV